jgi:hypothetical protein
VARRHKLISAFRALGFVLACLCLASVSAIADDAPDTPAGQNNADQKEAVQHLGTVFLPIAAAFNCPHFGWGSFVQNGTMVQLEYVPSGDNVEKWTRMMTVSIYALPKEAPDQIDAMRKMQGALLGVYGKDGHIIDQTLFQTSDGFPRMFVEYEVGEGPQKEHTAGAFLKMLPIAAQVIQIQARGKPFDPNDAANMKLFVQGKLSIPQTKTEPAK